MTSPPSSANQTIGSAALVPKNGEARRDSFVALLAHEIRNPLAPIRSGVALLKSNRVNERVRSETLAMMDRQLSHLVRLVDDLLASVSVRSGESLASAERVRLGDVLNAAVDSVRPAMHAKEQVLRLLGFDTPALVDADPQRLAQAFSNILNTSSRRTAVAGLLSVDVTVRDQVAVIRFSDNGPSIPEQELADVFELFAPSTMAIGEGLGIGLALVRGLIEMNGGSVDAVDGPSESGTVFVVRLPVVAIADAPTSTATPPAPDAARWRSLRVLVVDDNRDAAQTLGALLELDGHTIRLAHNGPAAVAAAREYSPEVILMDIGLPGYNGLVATRAIRRMALSSSPMIVALTGWGSAADREATRAAGCDRHLLKPIDYREIAQTLAFAPANPRKSE